MKIQYAISLWNFFDYIGEETLDEVLERIRRLNFGVELWGWWRNEDDLYRSSRRPSLKAALAGMPVSMHSAIVHTLERHQEQIDTAQALNARVIVVHQDEFYIENTRELDVKLCQSVVDYAAERGVTIALENGQLPFIRRALDVIQGLKTCLDVGHVYLTDSSMADFLRVMENRLVHLHLQDLLSSAEVGLPVPTVDHYLPGTGRIPKADWRLLVEKLQEFDFNGSAVFEIRPRNPYQNSVLGAQFFDGLLGSM